MYFYIDKAKQGFSYKLCQNLYFRNLPFSGKKGNDETMLFPSRVPEVIGVIKFLFSIFRNC